MVRKAKGQVDIGDIDKVNKVRDTSSKSHRYPMPVFEHIPIGIVKYSLLGKHIDINEEYCRIVGYDKEELLAVAPKDLTHYEDYPLDVNLYKQLIAGQTLCPIHRKIDFSSKRLILIYKLRIVFITFVGNDGN